MTVLDILPEKSSHGKSLCRCICDCGAVGTVICSNLKSGNTKTCSGFKNLITIDTPYAYIHTHSGEKVKVDENMLDKVAAKRWCISNGYAVYRSGSTTASMHITLIGKKDNFVIDHIDRNPLNNTLENLRFVSKQLNSFNSKNQKNISGYRGVRKRGASWAAKSVVAGKDINLGSFITLEEAIEARKAAELKYFGENSPQYREEELKAL